MTYSLSPRLRVSVSPRLGLSALSVESLVYGFAHLRGRLRWVEAYEMFEHATIARDDEALRDDVAPFY